MSENNQGTSKRKRKQRKIEEIIDINNKEGYNTDKTKNNNTESYKREKIIKENQNERENGKRIGSVLKWRVS